MPTLDCPICQRKLVYTALEEIPCRPFCSRRCKLIDLNRWLNEEYRIREELSPAESDGQTGEVAPEESSEQD